MNVPTISITELKEILKHTPANQNIMLLGKHGIGKSQIVEEYFTSLGMPVNTMFAGQMSDPGDLIGLPRLVGQQTINALPYWFPTDGQPITLFLDELNRGRPEVLQAVMDLALNRKIAGQKLPEGSRLVAACNEGDEYQLTELDPALLDRFNPYNLVPTPSEWLMYAEERKLDSRVIDFITHNTEQLSGMLKKKTSDFDKGPSPRSWEKVAKAITSIDEFKQVHKKLIAGIIGPECANAFFNYLMQAQTVSGEDVLFRYPKIKNRINRLRLHEFAILNESIFRALTVNNYKDTKDYKLICQNLSDYIKDIYTDENKKEARADFAANLEKETLYKKATLFMFQIPNVYEILSNYIQGMKVRS